MKLFEPGEIGKLETKNRIIVAVNGIRGEASPDGSLSERAINRYVSYAKGGAGLITIGHIHIENEVENHLDGLWSNRPRIDSSIYIKKWSILADKVHDYGAKLSVQLSAGFGRMMYPDTLKKGSVVAPSPQPCYWDPSITARELTIEEIQKLVKAMGIAAARLKEAGIDAIELHGGAGHLIDQFLSGVWNKRTDMYGGELEGRIRFPMELVSSIKKHTSDDFPIIIRHSLKNYISGGRDTEESLEMAKRFQQAGVDAIHATAGCYEYRRFANPSTYQPAGGVVGMAELVKKAVSIPVITFGKLGDPEIAESVLLEGKADFVALARPFLADSDWANKVKQGNWKDIRPCIGCHDGCLQRSLENKYVSCAVNPAAGMEEELALKPAEKCKKVLVVGGGPGGMEAARVAAYRGHKVIILEKNARLGGNLIPASIPEFKRDLRYLDDYLSYQVTKLGIEVILGIEATPGLIKKLNPEIVILATGASPIIPRIPGINNDKVTNAIEILNSNKDIGQTVVIVGGGVLGCEVAVYLAEKGIQVFIVEMASKLAGDLNVMNKNELMEMLVEHNVNILINTIVQEITEDGVIVIGESKESKVIKADGVVLAVGLKPQDHLKKTLLDETFELYSIGDCVRPRKIMEAMWEGYRLARLI